MFTSATSRRKCVLNAESPQASSQRKNEVFVRFVWLALQNADWRNGQNLFCAAQHKIVIAQMFSRRLLSFRAKRVALEKLTAKVCRNYSRNIAAKFDAKILQNLVAEILRDSVKTNEKGTVKKHSFSTMPSNLQKLNLAR